MDVRAPCRVRQDKIKLSYGKRFKGPARDNKLKDIIPDIVEAAPKHYNMSDTGLYVDGIIAPSMRSPKAQAYFTSTKALPSSRTVLL